MFFVLCVSVSAQSWTPEEKQIVDKSKQCWDAWERAVREKNYQIWEDFCRPAQDLQVWSTTDGSLQSLESFRTGFDGWVSGVSNVYFENLQPLSIRIHGDLALVYFYATYYVVDQEKNSTRHEDQRFEVFRKVEGEWRWIGGMVSGKEIER
jgi:hypothetical protein